jgi:PAS domain S-box-containing protein
MREIKAVVDYESENRMPDPKPEDALLFRPEWSRVTLASIGDAVITTDTEGRVTFLNPVAESLTGWTQGEAVGVPLEKVFAIVHPETRKTVESPTVRALREGVNAGLTNRTLLIAKDGTERPIGPINDSAAPIRNDKGELAGVVLVFRDITELCRHERAVQVALTYADNIIATLREPFVVLDKNLRIKTANRAFYQTFETKKEETESQFIYDLGNGQWNIPRLRTLLDEVLSNHHSILDFEMEHDFPAIGKKFMLLNAQRFGSVDGQSDLILLAIEDITDRKRIEAALRQTEQHQRFILDSIPQKLVTTKPDGSVDYFNARWMEYTGLSFEQLKDWGWKQIIHPDDLEEHVRGWLHAIKTGEVYEHESRFRHADGEYRWHVSRGVPMRNEAGQIVMWVGANTDIHDIKLIELALVDSEIRYRRLFESAKDGILILDTESGRITDANPFMGELLGYSHEHFLGKELWEIGLFSDKSANEAAVRTLQDKGYIRYEHLPLETSSGLRVEVEVVANTYSEDHHKVIQCNIRDITERNRLENQMQEQAVALKDLHLRKDEFLAMLSHELRNPLAPISNAVHLLRLGKNEEPLQQKACAIIERQLAQLTRLVDELMEVSRITTGRVQLRLDRVIVKGIVDRAIETAHPCIDQRRHELTVSLPPQPIWLHADASRLEQVIVNLLTNAAKYTEEGGHIWLTVHEDGMECVLTVRDSGVGIAPELLPRIFDLFTQAERSLDRSQGGLGIGLALVQRLVELHGGKVAVTSLLGHGSEFVLRLPMLLNAEPQSPLLPPVKAKPAGPSLRILLVDDNVDSAGSLAMLLEASGHEVQIAHDGPTALQAAIDNRPDFMLLDIGLPGMDGNEVAKRIRQQSKLENVVLIAMTGYGQESDRKRSQEAGFNHHLVKPVKLATLEKLLAAPAALSPSLEQSNPTGASLRVLVVDDMRDTTHMLRRLLNAAGHEVRTASDGPSALAAALDFQPEVALLDISLPGMSGLELAKQIRQQSKLKDIVLVAMTGYGDEADRQRSLEAGFDHHLVKPADIRNVLEILATVSARGTE